MPGAEIGRRRPVRERRIALRAGASRRPRAPGRAYGVQGRGRPRHARAGRSDRGCRRKSQRLDRARPDGLPRPRARPRCAASSPSCIADLVRAPHFDEEHLEREKAGDPVRARRKSSTRPTISSTIICSRRHSTASRSAARCSATRRRIRAATRRGSASTGCDEQFVPSRLVLSASGKVDPSAVVELAERLFGDMASSGAPDRPRRTLHRRRAQRPPRASSRRIGASPSAASRRRRARCRRCRCSCRRSAAARRRGCSRSCARSAASLIRSMPGTRHSRIPAWSASVAPPSAARGRRIGAARARIARRDRGQADASAELDRAGRRSRPAC